MGEGQAGVAFPQTGSVAQTIIEEEGIEGGHRWFG
jgi:hypothetical protein